MNNSLNDMDISEKQSAVTSSEAGKDMADNPVTAQPLRTSVEAALDNYFTHLDGQPVTDLYQMVLAEVEAPLLEAVMRYTGDNQSQASEILGLNRGTLRKKLKHYGLL